MFSYKGEPVSHARAYVCNMSRHVYVHGLLRFAAAAFPVAHLRAHGHGLLPVGGGEVLPPQVPTTTPHVMEHLIVVAQLTHLAVGPVLRRTVLWYVAPSSRPARKCNSGGCVVLASILSQQDVSSNGMTCIETTLLSRSEITFVLVLRFKVLPDQVAGLETLLSPVDRVDGGIQPLR